MGLRWDRSADIKRLTEEIAEVALAWRVGAIEMNDNQRYALLLASAELAGEMSKDLPERLHEE